jgi:RNA polymerase sigma factor (sigma-70 family)
VARDQRVALFRGIRALYNVGTIGEQTDGQLVDLFATSRGEEAEMAFATLVDRHGPMVIRVCRSILRDEDSAQDAFQATFLVLVRRARAVRNRNSIGSWLYGVALRVATCERGSAARRQAHERRAAELSAATSRAATDPDLAPVLHEELNQLPERYRAALVLCYLEGLACEEAAQRLRLPVGTVKSRLARGRERLRDRLTRRGLAPSLGLGALVVAEGSEAAVPAILTDATVQAVMQLMTRGAASFDVISAAVVTSAGKVVKAMFLTKLKMAAVVTLAFVGIIAGVVVLIDRNRAFGAPPQDSRATTSVPVPQDRVVSTPPRSPQKDERGGPQTGGSIAFRKVELSTDDLVEATGLNLYKYQVDIPKEQRFRIEIRELKNEGSPARVLFDYTFQKVADGPITLRVCFLRRDHKLQGVLLSEEKDAEFRLDCSGCNPSGIATIVTLPLSGIEGTRKSYMVHNSDKDSGRDRLKETRLITIVASEPNKPAPPPTTYPRAEVVIVKDGQR